MPCKCVERQKTSYFSGAGAGLAQGQGWRSGGDRENNYTRYHL